MGAVLRGNTAEKAGVASKDTTTEFKLSNILPTIMIQDVRLSKSPLVFAERQQERFREAHLKESRHL
jgi:hypothetical protein